MLLEVDERARLLFKTDSVDLDSDSSHSIPMDVRFIRRTQIYWKRPLILPLAFSVLDMAQSSLLRH